MVGWLLHGAAVGRNSPTGVTGSPTAVAVWVAVGGFSGGGLPGLPGLPGVGDAGMGVFGGVVGVCGPGVGVRVGIVGSGVRAAVDSTRNTKTKSNSDADKNSFFFI
jgi:hypothetical protein